MDHGVMVCVFAKKKLLLNFVIFFFSQILREAGDGGEKFS